MKRFEYDAIKARLVQRMKMNSEYATILDDGAFTNLMDVFCEGLSETDRYIEYALLEKKWNTARNISSLTSMGELIGRKRNRPKSAMGYIVVSHTDANGNNRLANYGRYFFDLDEESDFDDIAQNTNANYIKKSALVPWTSNEIYVIPKGTIFTANNNTQFISTETVRIKSLTEKFSHIKDNAARLNEFKEAGGWDGIKYLKVPVIQGIPRTANIGTTTGARFETLSYNASNIENASNSISRNYFYINVIKSGTTERWAEIQNIRLAEPYDKVYEVKLNSDGSGITIKFGDGISGAIPPTGSIIELHYLETLGKAGNISSKFQIQSIALPNNEIMVDPRTGNASEFLSCINTTSIMGGKDLENEDEYKVNAPTSYLTSYTTAVKSAYEKQILENSPLSLSKIKCKPNSSFVATQIDNTMDDNIDDEVANELSIISNSLEVTAIKANGDPIEQEESETFMNYVIRALNDYKGPNDSLVYREPNLIKVAPSIKINTYDITVPEAEIISDIANTVNAEYSIFNQDFNEPLYSSKIVHNASLYSFTESVDLLLEAMANVKITTKDIKVMPLRTSTADVPLVAIPFQFDTIYAQNKYKSGFKNYKVEAPYLLKINVKFKNIQNDEKSRTFFLYDNRLNDGTISDLQSSKNKALTADDIPVKNPNATCQSAYSSIGYDLDYYDETLDNYDKRQVRVAQFPYISNITDEEFMGNAKAYATGPFEIRPYIQDSLGKNAQLVTEGVEETLRVSIAGDEDVPTTSFCYQKNTNWTDYVDIIFEENYDTPKALNYAFGYLILPVSFFEFGSLSEYNKADDTTYVTELAALISQYIDIKVFAQPLLEDIAPEEWSDIVYVDDDDVKVERNLMQKD